MTCYCKERTSNPKLAKEMKDIPIGYCGFCDVCKKPGHLRAHPRLPTTGTWCDQHWEELVKYRTFTLGDVIPYVFLVVITGIFIYTATSAWKLVFG